MSRTRAWRGPVCTNEWNECGRWGGATHAPKGILDIPSGEASPDNDIKVDV